MTETHLHIDVAVPLPVYGTYTYSVPKHLSQMAHPGKRVLVPFGQRKVTGYILGPCDPPERDDIKLILDILDDHPLFLPSMIPFFRWIADYYLHPIGEVIKSALPEGINLFDIACIAITETGKKVLLENSLTPLERDILTLLGKKSFSLKELRRKIKTDIPESLIFSMEHRGLLIKTREIKGQKSKEKTERFISLIRHDIPEDRFFEPRKKIIDALRQHGNMFMTKLFNLVPDAGGYISYLEKNGFVSLSDKRVFRDPLGDPVEPDTPPLLTHEQKQVIDSVAGSIGNGFSTFLLTGVTGSGKTEVYMQIADTVMAKGHSVLVLVPEISLISQTEGRFRARFGECIAVLHSSLSSGERFDQWTRIANNEVSIVIGARSAVFAPLSNMGAIIVDEEHDTSYKQDTGLRYNARDIAVMRAKLEGCVALLGSATPSVQSYHNASAGKFIGVNLENRVNMQPLPEITLIDLRNSRDTRGIRRFITPELHREIKETLDRREQVLLFLNRRGFAAFPVCGACGEAIRCKNCDISMTLHKKANAFKCHFCGYSRPSISSCAVCGSSDIRLMGTGTEKIEEAVKTLFPDARVDRLDRDTTTRKNEVVRILKRLRNNKTDILIGTQMVVKGHDFPDITLVGVICADLSLSFPDFRSGERTFQLLAQVAGRAGRGSAPGKVILQTYNPDHFSIMAAKTQDYKKFYNQEIRFRKELNYPPFSRLVQLKISGKDSKKTEQHARLLGECCIAMLSKNRTLKKSIDVLGPVEAPLPKIAKHFRWQILIKSRDIKQLHEFIQMLLSDSRNLFKNSHVKVAIDVDPFFMM